MTQKAMRRVIGLFALAITTIYTVSICYMRDQDNATLSYQYEQEMRRRVVYVTAMLEWLPNMTVLTATEKNTFSSRVPFVLTFSKLNEGDVVTVTKKFPIIASDPSTALGLTISLRENFNTQPNLGCEDELMATGACFIFIALASMFILLKIANVIVYWKPSLSILGNVVTGIAVAFPVIMAVLMMYEVVSVQANCAVASWSDSVSRSATLYAEVYKVLSETFPTSFPVSLLIATLLDLNTNFIEGGDYSANVVNYTAGSVDPPVANKKLHDALISVEAADPNFAIRVPGTNELASSHSLPQEGLLVAVSMDVGNSMPHFNSEAARNGVLLVAIPSVVSALLCLIFFPFAALGKLSGVHDWMSPWVWRTSKQWPLWKLLQGAAILAFTVGMTSLFIARLSAYYDISHVLQEFIAVQISTSMVLVGIGRDLMSNYGGIMQGLDWDTAALEYAKDVSDQQLVDASRFYQRVFTSLEASSYTLSSGTDAARSTPEEDLPLLNNTNEIQEFIRENLNDVTRVQLFEGNVHLYDIEVILYIISLNVQGLTVGPTESREAILEYALLLGGESAKTSMDNICKSNIKLLMSYATMAQRFANQVITPEDIKGEYATQEGREVVQLEESAFSDSSSTSSEETNYGSVYTWKHFQFTGCAIAAICVVGFCAMLDYLFTAVFFASSLGPKSADRPLSSGLLSNDYTAPSSFLNVNHHNLWVNTCYSMLMTLIITLIAVIAVAAASDFATSSVAALVSQRAFDDENADPTLELASEARSMCASGAAWLRAYLSHNNQDILTATQLTYAWTDNDEVSWEGGRPQTYGSTETNDAAEFREKIRIVSNLVNALYAVDPLSSIYQDFVSLLMQFADTFDASKFEKCLKPDKFLLLMQTLKKFILAIVYVRNDDFDSIYAELGNFSAVNCNIRDDDIISLKRIQGLRVRSTFFPSRQEVARDLETSSFIATTDTVNSVMAASSVAGVTSVEQTPLMWLPVLFVWVSILLLFLLFTFARRMFLSIYYS